MYEMITLSAEEDGEKPELLNIAWENVKTLTYCKMLVYRRVIFYFLCKERIAYHLTLQLRFLVYSREMKMWVHTQSYTLMLKVPLFLVAKDWFYL